MSSQQLKAQLEQQLNRLLKQLQDCEDLKEELDEEEYQITKNETLEQMKEFEATLKKMAEGNISLTSEIEKMKLAVRASISNAFKTPEVIKLFASAQPKQLRVKLENLSREFKLGKVPKEVYNQQASELLFALQKLGEKLSPAEESFLNENMTQELKSFVSVVGTEEVGKQQNLLSQAGSQIEKAKK